MKRNVKIKIIALMVILTQMFTCAAFAAIKSGTVGSTGNELYYWQQNFNDYTGGTPNGFTIPTTLTAAQHTVDSNTGDYALKITNSNTSPTNSAYVTVKGTTPYNLTKGDVVISYDVTFTTSSPKFRTQILGMVDGAQKGVGVAAYFNSTKIQGYITGGTAVTSTLTSIAKNTKYNVAVSMHYNQSNETIIVKQYINNKEMINGSTRAPFEYVISGTAVQSALKASSWDLRFYVYGKTTAIVDNVTVRNEGQVSLPNGAWINTATAGNTIQDSIGTVSGLSYIKSINKLTTSDFTVTSYDIKNDPFMLTGGTAVDTSELGLYNDGNYFNISKIPTNSNGGYVFELTNPKAITDYAGDAIDGKYIYMYNGVNSLLRKASIYNSSDEKIAITDGKLPKETAKIEFDVSETYADAIYEAGSITLNDENGVTKAKAKQNGITFTLDNLDKVLVPGTDYTISLPSVSNVSNGATINGVSKTYTTTGEKPVVKTSREVERFDGATLPSNLIKSTSTDVTFALNEGALKYTSALSETATTMPAVSYLFNKAFDFSKGDMLVSFDFKLLEPLNASFSSGTNLFNPEIVIGDKIAAYMPSLEYMGVRGRNTSGGRLVITTEDEVIKPQKYVSVGDTHNISILLHYNEGEGTYSYTQYFNGNPVMYTVDDVPTDAPVISNEIGAIDFSKAVTLRFRGRAIKGLSIDNIALTTIPKNEADRTFTVSKPVIDEDNNVSVGISNSTVANYPLYIIVATYDNKGNLVNVETEKKTVRYIDDSYSLASPIDMTGAVKAKVFVWDGFENIVPYAENAEK